MNYQALRLGARLALRLGRWSLAQAVFERMAAQMPQDDYPLASIAYLHILSNRKPEALAALQRLTHTHPRVGKHWFNLGFLQEEQGLLDQAHTSFTQAVALCPGMDRAWYGLALVLIRLQRLEEAIKALQHNTRLQPMSPYGWYQLARVRMELQQPQEAKQIIRHLQSFEPKVAAQLEREMGLLVSPVGTIA